MEDLNSWLPRSDIYRLRLSWIHGVVRIGGIPAPRNEVQSLGHDPLQWVIELEPQLDAIVSNHKIKGTAKIWRR